MKNYIDFLAEKGYSPYIDYKGDTRAELNDLKSLLTLHINNSIATYGKDILVTISKNIDVDKIEFALDQIAPKEDKQGNKLKYKIQQSSDKKLSAFGYIEDKNEHYWSLKFNLI